MSKKSKHLFSNKTFYTLLALVMLAGVSYMVYSYVNPVPNPGHGADTVWIAVNNQEMTLQQAIDTGALGASSPAGSGGFVCKPVVASTGYCNISSVLVPTSAIPGVAEGYCCGVVDPSAVTIHDVFIGVDNNGGNSPDCWGINQGTGYFASQTCGHKQWDLVGTTNYLDGCINGLKNVYNSFTNPDGTKGGWIIQGFRDTLNASVCVDTSSDVYAVKMIRYNGY